MRRIAIVVGIVVLAFVVGYIIGFWPERRARTAAERDLMRVEMELQTADARSRAAALLGLLLTIEDSVSAQNYGLARGYAARLFEAARVEQNSPVESLREAINRIVGQRNDVTVALSMADPAIAPVLREMEHALRRALGYPMPATA
jgi:FtsZ-interacting cell division protein ZipA